MTSLKTGATAEPANGGFSYAQAAKGRSPSAPSAKTSTSSAVSGTVTPASASIPDSTPGSSWADDVEASNGTAASDVQKSSEEAKTQSTNSSKDISSHEGPSPSADADSKSTEESHVTETKPTTVTDGASSSAPREQSSASERSTSDELPAQTTANSENTPDEQVKEKAPPKPVYQEAKPPTVNIWAQRAAEAKARAAAQGPTTQSSSTNAATHSAQTESDRNRGDIRRKSDQPFAAQSRKTDQSAKSRDDGRNPRLRRESRTEDNVTGAPRRSATKPRERANSEVLAAATNEVSWPKPMAAPGDEGRKKPTSKEEPYEKDRTTPTTAKGKPEWKAIPFTPTAVFETQVSGKGAGRMGKGAARGGHAPIPRNTAVNGAAAGENARLGPRSSSLPNGDDASLEKADTIKADREAMPPPPTKLTSPVDSEVKELENGLNSTSDVSGEQSKIADQKPATSLENGRPGPHTRRNKSPRKSDGLIRRNGSVHEASFQRNGQIEGNMDQAAGESVQQTSKSTFSDRRPDMHPIDTGRDMPPFREGKRGGRKGGRGTFNAQFSSPHHYSNSFQEFPNGNYGMGSQFASRGGHFSQNSRSGYRNQGMRSQSIPDPYGRQIPYGYPMMPMQPFQSDFYGPYPASPYPYTPASERDMVVAQVLGQVDYYFSLDNLLKDIFLRKHMDSHGWILLDVIAQFNRLRQLTTDYEIIKSACLQSQEIEIRVAEDGKERLRRATEWEKFVLPMEDRDESARNEPPQTLSRPSAARVGSFEQSHTFHPHNPTTFTPQTPNGNGRMDGSFTMMNGGPPPFYPSGIDSRYQDYGNFEESRGRQNNPDRQHENIQSPMTNGFGSQHEEINGESDKFPSSQIDGLTVVVRKQDPHTEAPFHSANSRTFSNGSINSHDGIEEMSKNESAVPTPQTNGTSLLNGDSMQSLTGLDSLNATSPSAAPSPLDSNGLRLFWVKDKESPVDVRTLPVDTTPELYTHLRFKALSQRNDAATGTCPYDLDVLYQFWSHFLIRNFNSTMYAEFRHFALEDIRQRHNDVGFRNLLKYYSEALSSRISIRDNVAADFADILQSESQKSEGLAFSQLYPAWRDGNLNLKNRKKLGNLLDADIKTKLDS